MARNGSCCGLTLGRVRCKPTSNITRFPGIDRHLLAVFKAYDSNIGSSGEGVRNFRRNIEILIKSGLYPSNCWGA